MSSAARRTGAGAARTVLMTTDTVGGVFTYAVELIRAFEAHGVNVLLATMGRLPDASQRRELNALGNVQVFESSYRLEWMPDPWDDVRLAGDWLLELEARYRPDIVHLNGYAHGALGWNAPAVVVGHSCVLSWWEAVQGETIPTSWNRYREAVTRGLRSATAVVAPSQAMLDRLECIYGPVPSPRVIPNGRDRSAFAPGQKQPFLMTAGRLWDQAKNVGMLEYIAPRLHWPLYAAGDGASSEAANFFALGHLSAEALAEWLAEASIYVLSARYEPFGLSILEAALSGCALVLGDIPSLRENWDGAALFVSPDDPQDTERIINSLIDDGGQRRRLQRAAWERAQQFTPAAMARDYMAVYQGVLNRRLACAS